MKLSAIVLTKNEGRNIPGGLAGLPWADEMLVVDSGSQNATVALAEKFVLMPRKIQPQNPTVLGVASPPFAAAETKDA